MNSFPNKDNKEIKNIAKSFYKQFSRSFLESLKSLTISKARFKSHFKILNPELLDEVYQKNKSIMLYGSHFGNWEWMAYLPSYTKVPMYSFYQKVKNKFFNDLMLHTRQRFGNECIESGKGTKLLIQNTKKQKHGIYYLIGDQSPNKSSSFEWFSFLKRETAFLMGAPKLANRFAMHSIFAKTKMIKPFYYSVEFISFPENLNAKEMAEFYVTQLERNIQDDPHLWLWSHRRWKLKKK